jgi:hypothetical protein
VQKDDNGAAEPLADPYARATGKPSSYDLGTMEEIHQRIMHGEYLSDICREPGMPTWQNYYRWLEKPGMREAHTRARLGWADFWAERGLKIAMDGSNDIFIDGAGKAMLDHANVQRSRLQCDQIKWMVGKYAPRTYGDKPQDDAGESKTLTISWLKTTPDVGPPERPQPPRQLVYHKPQLPGDLTEADWSVMLEVLELVKRTVPTNDERPPAEIMGVIKTALLKHFEEV